MKLSNDVATVRELQRSRVVGRMLLAKRRALQPIPIPSGELQFTFDALNPEVITWAEVNAAKQITLVNAATKAGVRQLVLDMFTEGIAPAAAARRIRELVPRTRAQRTAYRRLERELLNPDNFGKRITRFAPRPGVRELPGFRVRIPPGGLSKAALNRRLAQYAQMQLNLRARNIARTESIRAANEGQRQAWKQARTRGEIGMNALREWTAATGDNRTCVVCEELDGETATLDGDFPGGIDGPPAHPSCRCSTSLVTEGGVGV